ncbi:MarR family transcriptional regulator [Ectobacillus funiculus]
MIWNQQLVKKENKSIVLNLIMNNSPISRADIAQTSGLNKGTVSSLVAELLEEQLIYESGPGESSGADARSCYCLIKLPAIPLDLTWVSTIFLES